MTVVKAHVRGEMFQKQYAEVFEGDAELAQSASRRRARASSGTTLPLTSSGRRTSMPWSIPARPIAGYSRQCVFSRCSAIR